MGSLVPRGFVPAPSAVPGITVFKPAPPADRLEAVVAFRCPQCGGETAYSVEDGGLTCTYCGYHEAPQVATVGRGAESFEFTVETVERAANGWGVTRKELQCQSCGSRMTLPEGALTSTCPFCGSNQVIHHAAPQDVLRPRFLVPFEVDEVRCHQIARAWLGSSWMVPAELRRVAAVEEFTPIYLPFWTFAATADASWRAQVGHTKTYRDSKGRTRHRTEWRWESGHVRPAYDDLLVRGTTHVSIYLLEQLGRFDLDGLVPYEPQFLAGLQAQAYEIGLEEAWAEARRAMREQTRQKCRDQASTSKIRNFSMQLDFQDESWRYILLPVYINTYFFENKSYQLLINGQSGIIAGQRPADWRKVGLVAAALILPGILLFLLFLLLMPEVYGQGGGFWSFLLFAAGLAVAVAIAWRAQALDKA